MSSDIDIGRAMLAHLNTWSGKPCNITLAFDTRKDIEMKMQPLSGTVIMKKYVDGTFIGEWPFAVYVRIKKASTAARADAAKYLDRLGMWVASSVMPDIGANRVARLIEMKSLPSVAAQYEDGSEDYQAVYRLEYKQVQG